MSSPETSFVCPNCNSSFAREYNYCPECGQEVHLHKETFFGLIMHFIGHYFHYDSKFLQTLKALWFSPGKLTIAYRNRQRVRYIPPISLYIFISATFFLVNSLMPPDHIYINRTPLTHGLSFEYSSGDHKDTAMADTNGQPGEKDVNSENKKEVVEHFFHIIPRVFFFMIPLMALILKVLFVKRKELFFVDHIIFALHYHSFWFSTKLLRFAYPFARGGGFVYIALFFLSAWYFIASLKKVYDISWSRAVVYSIVTGTIYLVFMIAAATLVAFAVT